jgi:hypothetical protein
MKRMTYAMRMNTQRLVMTAVALACFAPAVASAQNNPSLNLNFAATDPDAATSSLSPTDVAGVVPAANWNNLETNVGTNVGSLELNNNGTAAPSAATVTWTSNNTWRAGANSSFGFPNSQMMSGYLDTLDTAAGGITVTVNNIDAALRNSSYDVYVYFIGDSPDNRGGGYTIDDGTGPQLRYGSTMATPFEFVEDPGLDIDNSVDGNYIRFRRLNGSSFTITTNTTLTTPNGFRAPINGIQIVGGQGNPGDVNNDGSANIADYNIIRDNLEKAVPQYTMGDLNGDAKVDLNDFRRWTNFAPPSVVASLGVPEPSAAVLGLSAALLAVARARRRRT